MKQACKENDLAYNECLSDKDIEHTTLKRDTLNGSQPGNATHHIDDTQKIANIILIATAMLGGLCIVTSVMIICAQIGNQRRRLHNFI